MPPVSSSGADMSLTPPQPFVQPKGGLQSLEGTFCTNCEAFLRLGSHSHSLERRPRVIAHDHCNKLAETGGDRTSGGEFTSEGGDRYRMMNEDSRVSAGREGA
jgi:hypothetical protein